jgi:HD-like signal output (HDOD) protein
MQNSLVSGSSALLAGVALIAGLSYMQWRRRRPGARQEETGKSAASGAATGDSAAGADAHDNGDIPFADEATARITRDLYELAFGTFTPETGVSGDHAAVLKAVRDSMGDAITDRQYFPRKPTVIPQLLKAVKSNEGAVKELVDIIMKDPVLTGDVLKLANSAYYKTSGGAVDTLGRAVMVLGTDGLRALVSASLLQPVFRAPKGCFDHFAEAIWDRAFKAALASQIYARRTRSCDSFTAHLTGLLSYIGWIVLFRLTADKYTQMPTVQPAPQVFVTILEESADKTSRSIAENWELAQPIQDAIREHIQKLPVNQMSPLGKALYYGQLCSTCALLVQHDKLGADEAKEIAMQKGLREKDFDQIWQSLMPASS